MVSRVETLEKDFHTLVKYIKYFHGRYVSSIHLWVFLRDDRVDL